MEKKRPAIIPKEEFSSDPLFQVLGTNSEVLSYTTIFRAEKSGEGLLYLTEDCAPYVYSVLRGRVHVENVNIDGTIGPVYRAFPGKTTSLFGVESVLKRLGKKPDEEVVYDHQAVLFSDSVLARIDARIVSDQLKKTHRDSNSHLPLYFLESLLHIERQIHTITYEAECHSTTQKIATLLLDLYHQYGEHISVQHKDIARWCASTRETITHLMNDLKLQGIIQQHLKSITLCDTEKLEAIISENKKKSITDPYQPVPLYLPQE